jgi:Tfp pilus assembly PilM family ATPase
MPTMRATPWLAPTPPSVAIEIASGRVTVVELSRGGMPTVIAHASESLPVEAVVPALTGVNIARFDDVAAALGRALERAGLRSTRRAALVVPDGIARVTLLPFEHIPDRAADLEQLLRLQLRKSMPFSIDEALITHFRAHTEGSASTLAAVVARRDVIAQYEAVTTAAGIHAGIVDLASLNVMNALMSAGAAAKGDALLVCLAPEGTTLAILRGQSLMFYRHRTAVDEESLGALVHQTAMYHEDRLGGTAFTRVWLCGGARAGREAAASAADIEARLGIPVESVDIRPAAALGRQVTASPDVLDAVAASVGVLLRERKAA